MTESAYPFNTVEFNFKRQRKDAEQAIRQRLDEACASSGYRWTKGNIWLRSHDWCLKRCVLTITTVGSVEQPTLSGGASIFLEDYYKVYRRDDDLNSTGGLIASLGAPVYALDERITTDWCHFSSMEQLGEKLPVVERAFVQRVLPELERYQTEDDLLRALLAPDWLTSVKLFASRDRRASLAALMLAKREGPRRAIDWASTEVERIRAEKPLVTSTARFQELLRCIDHLKRVG